jgi:hypothetical protein
LTNHFDQIKKGLTKNHQKSPHRDVAAEVNGDPKGCFTVIAAIKAVCERLPLFKLATGTTKRCKKHNRSR